MTSSSAATSRNERRGAMRFSLRALFIAFAFAGFLFFAIGVGHRTISTALQAERTLHAINFATILTTRFVRREKCWPQTWDDLCTVRSPNSWAWYEWPRDVSEIRNLVTVDFNTDVREIARQSSADFQAIRPAGACYAYKHYGHVDALIDTTRRVTKRAAQPE